MDQETSQRVCVRHGVGREDNIKNYKKFEYCMGIFNKAQFNLTGGFP
jgi:hypothetical protein